MALAFRWSQRARRVADEETRGAAISRVEFLHWPAFACEVQATSEIGGRLFWLEISGPSLLLRETSAETGRQ